MGCANAAQCLDCGKAFTVTHGDGFFFHLLRCGRCGKARAIGFDELGELVLRHLSGSVDEPVRRDIDVEPVSVENYWSAVEAFAGRCDCGDTFAFDAPARCPACRSLNFEEGSQLVLYD